MPLRAGSTLGPYEIRGPLGAGGMGEVYRAYDPRLGRDVALKILPESMAQDAEGLSRFTREARALAALNHPHIVTIFSTEEADSGHGAVRYLTMELVEGRTLDQIIGAGGVSMPKFFDVAIALADALGAAHQRQITHRDLKPANVMITDDGRVKVLDFGLSRPADPAAGPDDDATQLKLTQAGTILGTRPYMSPEQIEARALDGRSDIFSLGIVLYELATGRRPFNGETSASLMSSILRDHPRSIAEFRGDVPDGVVRIVERCLEKSPRDRIQSAQEILIELRAQRRAWESGASDARPRTSAVTARSGQARSSDLRIAVLPLVSRTPGGDAEALADGLTDDITAGLARFPYLRVVSRHDVDAAKGRSADAQSAALVGARYLLDGMLRTSSASTRIALRLVDAETGAHLWAETFDRSLAASSVFELQDDLTNRIVATVADFDGVLVRLMAGAVRGRPVEELTLDEIVLRYFAYVQSFRADEHLRLRAAFERALEAEPQHALAWGCLSDLYEFEHQWGFNPLPDSPARARAAADRLIDIDPACQFGWRQLAVRHHADRDFHGLRMAAERTIQLNPLSGIAPFVAMLLAYAGDWERGMPIVRRAMDLNRHHAGWYHFPVFVDHFRKGELGDALSHAKASNAPQFPLTPLDIAIAAGALGRAGDALAAIDAIRRNHTAFLDVANVRALWGFWVWDDALVDRLVEGFEQAVALAGSPAGAPGQSAAGKPPSGAAPASNASVRSRRDSTVTLNRELSTTVAPFSVQGSDAETEGLARALGEDVATGLSRFPYLTVQTAVGADARYRIEGGVRRSADHVRVAVRLVDADTGVHLWAETYDRSLASANLFELQDDLTNRIVATVADSDGVLVRSMAGTVRERSIDELTLDELVLRYYAFIQNFRPDEHLRLRDGFERALAAEPHHALAWGCLSDVINIERVFGYNPLPDSRGRAWAAAERSIEIEPACQFGWRQIALRRHDDHDLLGLRMAAERTTQLNPLSTSTPFVAMLLAYAGDWDRGMPIIRRAMDLNRQHAGWYHFPVFTDHFRKGEFEEALAAAKATNTHFPLTPIAIAAAAGELGRTGDAVAAADTLRRNHPPFLDSGRAREAWACWIWDDGLIDSLIAGFEKGIALADGGVAVASPSSSPTQRVGTGPPSSGAARSGRASASVNRELTTIVAPFSAQGSDTEMDALARGLGEDIATGLSRFPFLTVQTTQAADARYRLEGGVRRSGDLVRVSVRVVDSDSGTQLWAESYDRTLRDTGVFDLQDDLTARVVATLADTGGVFVRAMGTPLRDRPVEDLPADELVVRYCLYITAPSIDEHARLRAAFERMVEARPNHALAWGCLSALYDHERSLGLNPLPDSLERCIRAARRSVEIDPACQQGWMRLVAAHHHANDARALRQAAERVVALNPLNQSAMAFVGMALAVSGDWERGVPMVRRAMDLDPNTLGLHHIVLFADHYRKREYAEALAQAKLVNASETALAAMAHAAAAGQLGRAEEARAALGALRRDHPGHDQAAKVRALWEYWLRTPDLVDQLVDGFEKALQLVDVSKPRPSSGRSASIAVLPFTDLSAAKDQEWFCDGIAEEILTTLSQVKGLTVAARASAFSFRGRGDDLAAIGDKLHVTTVLDGSVRRAGDRLRVTVRLSDVANGYQIWSDRYDRDVKDVFDVQDEIARAIAERLRVGLGGDDAPRVVRHTDNQEAYHLYLRGRHLWYSRSKGSLLRARQLYEEATTKDPDYVLPYVGLADLYSIQSLYGFEREEIAEPRARAAVARALALNDQVADAHRAAGFAHMFFGYDMQAAVTAFERSVELDPTSGLTHIWLGWPVWPGRDATAIAAARRAQELDPLNPYIHSLAGAIYDFYERSEEGLREFDKAFEIDPNYLVGLYLGGGVYSRLGRHDEALRLFGRGVELTDRAPFYVACDAWARARAGRTDEARTALAELEARASSEYVQPLHFAIVKAALGQIDQAFDHLADGVRRRNGWIGVPRMPMFEEMRHDPRYAEHLRRIGHPDAARVA